MNPTEFLRLTGSAPEFVEYAEREVGKPEYDALAKRIETGLPVDAPFLDVDIQSGLVTSHEGRHRALIAKSLGLRKIPVILYHSRNLRLDPYHREDPFYPKQYRHLIPQGTRVVKK